jgi:hypothetical protein
VNDHDYQECIAMEKKRSLHWDGIEKVVAVVVES